jgi:hypothetical protein
MGSNLLAQHAPRRGQAAISFAMMVAIVASFFASFVGVSIASAQSIDTSLAETVPADSAIYVAVDLDQSSDQWNQVFTLLERAGLSDLAEDEVDASPEELGDLAEMYEFTGSAALVMTSADALVTTSLEDVTGQALDATVDPMEIADDVPEGLVVVFQPDNPDALHANFQQMIADEADQAGTTVDTASYNGVTIEYWTSMTPDMTGSATARVNDTVILSPRPSDIEPVIDTMMGDLESLASDANFTEVADAFTTDSLMFMYVNGMALLEAGAAMDPELAALSNGAAGYIGVNAYADEAGFRMDTVSISSDGDSPVTFDPTMAQRMPAESLLFVNGTDIASTGLSDALGMFLQLALAETDETGMSATPMATPDVDQVYLELERQLGFNIKTDLIDQLDGEWALSVNVDQIMSETPDVDLVFVSEVSDEMTVGDTTDQISFIVSVALDDPTVTIEDRPVGANTVTSVTIVDEFNPDNPMHLEWAVIDGEFILGVNNGITTYLEGTTQVLADDPIYQRTMDALPATDVVGVLFVNLDRAIPMIEDAMMSFDSSMSILDADEACGDYATQEEAQAAYDEDEFGLWNLDLDYDGVACEDYFADTSATASPVATSTELSILSIGSVSYMEGDMYRNSSILLIGD